jgi:hypothetical protein
MARVWTLSVLASASMPIRIVIPGRRKAANPDSIKSGD